MSNEFEEILDGYIDSGELREEIRKLKSNKAAWIDCIIPEVFKLFSDYHVLVVVKLFNHILNTGDFPKEWEVGIIVPIFKKGITADLNNYRRITLLSVAGKLLPSVLNNRLEKVAAKFTTLCENQAGFRKGYRTTDHIFTLSTIISHFINAQKTEIFARFVDFTKAFDKVSHSLLRSKLI